MDRHLPQVQLWFDRFGKWTLFFGYFLAGVRHFTALAAGMTGVRPAVFAGYAYTGGFVWVASFLAIGYFLGEEWDQLRHHFERGATAAVVIVVAVSVIAWAMRRRARV